MADERFWAWVDAVLRRLQTMGCDEGRIAGSADSPIERLRADVERERDRLAQQVFDAGVAAGRVEFCLRADKTDYELPLEYELRLSGPAQPLTRGIDAREAQKSLLEPALRTRDMNALEQAVAIYLDEKEALRWWHRNVARAQYGLQGWQRHKVYPDFVFAHVAGDGPDRLVLLETKGLHLGGSDTAYKQALLDRLTQAFGDERFASAGELVLEGGRERLVCDLVFDQAWRGALEQRHFGVASQDAAG